MRAETVDIYSSAIVFCNSCSEHGTAVIFSELGRHDCFRIDLLWKDSSVVVVA
jgi:hypothetical protein